MCGHDGHMTILMALARLISRNRPATGRVILMFQPAEENGSVPPPCWPIRAMRT